MRRTRKENGPGYLVNILIEKLKAQEIEINCNNIIVDGIKNEGEIELLRSFANFYLFSVHADGDIRQERVLAAKRFKSEKEFLEADNRDQHENYSYGQQVKRCDYLSDIIILNRVDYPYTLTNKKEDFIRGIYRKYIKLIEDNVNGEISPENTPSINELCMTISYSLSKMSSCLKRKVGSVIIDIDGDIEKADQKNKIFAYPFVVSSGFNEVPLGSEKCIFHQPFQKCYRDHLQEEHAKKIKYCPNCGEKIEIKTTCRYCKKIYDGYVKFCSACKKEIKEVHNCKGCGINIYEEHLPGGKKTPGKLLDMCRSLHAEEVAILRLSKMGGNRGNNLVLYATTQPCNLCANKIVSAGLSKVVFAEPYLMPEAAEILENGKVKLERFEGVKSSAYFKLYK